MYVSVEDVNAMSEVKETMVYGQSIVALLFCGEFVHTKQDQPKYDNVEKVPFYDASDFQIKAFKRLLGEGTTKADRVDRLNEELNSFHNVQVEEISSCDKDYYEFSLEDAMPGAFELPWHDVGGLSL